MFETMRARIFQWQRRLQIVVPLKTLLVAQTGRKRTAIGSSCTVVVSENCGQLFACYSGSVRSRVHVSKQDASNWSVPTFGTISHLCPIQNFTIIGRINTPRVAKKIQ